MSERREAQRMLAAYRRAIMPEPIDEARTWARLEAREDAGGADEARPRGRMWWVVAIAVAAAAIVVVAWPRPEHRVAGSIDAREQSVRGHASESSAAPAVAREPSPVPPSLPPAELPAVRVQSPRAPVATARPRPIAADPLRAELEAISTARAALDRGDLGGALDRIAAYRRRFGDGALAIEARAIGAAARCRLGPIEVGRREARGVLVDPAAAAYRDLLHEACDLQ